VEPQTTSTGHVFISYAREDQRYVRKLEFRLRKRGFKTWMDEHIDSGDRWSRTIVQAIQDSAALVVVMTPDAWDSEWVEKEILLAQQEEKPIFPLLLRGQVLPILIDTQYDDVTNRKLPAEEFYERLKQAIEVQSEEDSEVEESESGDAEPGAPEKPTPEVWSWLRHLPPLAKVILLLLVALLVGVIGWLVASKLLASNPEAATAVETALPPTDTAIATATSQPPSPTPSATRETPLDPPTPTATSTALPTPDPLRPNIKLGLDPSNPFTHENEPERVFTFHWDGGCIVSEDIPPNLTEMDIELRRGQGEGSDMWLGTTNIEAIKDGLGCDTETNWNTFKLHNLQDAPAISGQITGSDGEVEKTLGFYPSQRSLYWRLKICDEGGMCWSWPDDS
jgi:hypothetical protein